MAEQYTSAKHEKATFDRSDAQDEAAQMTTKESMDFRGLSIPEIVKKLRDQPEGYEKVWQRLAKATSSSVAFVKNADEFALRYLVRKHYFMLFREKYVEPTKKPVPFTH